MVLIKKLLKRRAVSAVISTVIIVAVTIAVAIAVAYWMGGLTSVFLRFEKIEVKSAYVVYTAGNYVVNLSYVNTGATQASIDSILLNGVPTSSFGAGAVALTGDFASGKEICEIGVSKSGIITFKKGLADPSGNQLSAGVTLTITIHTTGGKDYHATVTLP